MTRDFFLTLLALSLPFLLAAIVATIVTLAMTRRPAQGKRVRRTVEACPPRRCPDNENAGDTVGG